MKKALSIFLVAMMLFTAFAALPVSAAGEIPEEIIADALSYGYTEDQIVAISSADSFNLIGHQSNANAIDPDQYFYLTQDITITRTQNLNRNDFKGVFNGCDNTITCNNSCATGAAALFEGALNGATIKNLNVDGTFERTEARSDQTSYAILAEKVNGGEVKIENVHVNVTMNVTYGGSTLNSTTNQGIGGLLGLASDGSNTTVGTITFNNCSMTGEVNVTFNNETTSQTNKKIGGIVGYAATGSIVMNNCTNNAAITVSNKGAAAPSTIQIGGLVAYANQAITLKDCDNNGSINVSGVKKSLLCGGLVGSLNNVSASEISSSDNNAPITVAVTDVSQSSKASSVLGGSVVVGGLLGWADSCDNVAIKDSSNTKDINASYDNYGCNVGGIFGAFAYGVDNTAENCSNFGKLSTTYTGNEAFIENVSSIGMSTTKDGDASKPAVTMSNCFNNVFSNNEFSAHATTNKVAIENGCKNTTIRYEKYQLSDIYDEAIQNQASGSFRKVRFIATINIESLTEFKEVGLIIKTVTDNTGSERTYGGTYGGSTNYVYTSLLANKETVTAESLGGSHFVLHTIGDIPTGAGTVLFEITPFTVSADGTTNYGVKTDVAVDFNSAE